MGLLALPLRMTSVLGSKMLTSFSGTCVSPPKIRARACCITCRTLGAIVSNSLRRPSSAACLKTSRDVFTPVSISREKRFACPTTREVAASSFRYPCCNFSLPTPPLLRAARPISRIRYFTLRPRSRSLAPASPAMAAIRFIARVRTRTPSPSKLLSVG